MSFKSLCLLALLTVFSCKELIEDQRVEIEHESYDAIGNDDLETGVIYEVNVRQYSKEGTFEAFAKDIPSLKKMGVNILWLMPIHPISLTKRKATGSTFVSDIKDPDERKKYLGSYYSVSDYRGINRNFGSAEDFKKLVSIAHEEGMFVILDWVPNHTGWDHPWILDHPEYYTKNEVGEIIDPTNPATGESWGWTDVADLNYNNKELWHAMAEEMKYWINEFDIDGFRCDVAGEVPVEFWDFVTPQLRIIKPIFMLAESESRPLFRKSFDMGYNWEGHHIMNDLCKENKSPMDWKEYMERVDSTYEDNDILMNFVTNHDENSWAGTVGERMGQAKDAMIVFSYLMPGMPLIYSGLEYNLSHRQKFFEKDEIPKLKKSNYPLLVKLGNLKKRYPALHGGKNAADYKYHRIDDNENVMLFERYKNGQSIFFLANLGSEKVEVNLPIFGLFEDLIQDIETSIEQNELINMKPWSYKVLLRK